MSITDKEIREAIKALESASVEVPKNSGIWFPSFVRGGYRPH